MFKKSLILLITVASCQTQNQSQTHHTKSRSGKSRVIKPVIVSSNKGKKKIVAVDKNSPKIASVDIVDVEKAEVVFVESGSASWYGAKYAGKPTASGELFDPAEMTAAHKKLPFGTLVKVERVDNGESVIVRINDRGPFTKRRVIDVSKAAAEKLDMVNAGIVKVKIYKISE